MNESVRILIVDDHLLFLEGLRAIFLSVPDLTVIGTASSGEEAIQQAKDLSPDVILMDIQMADMNGIEATKRILDHQPHIKVIMLTMLQDSESLFSAMVAGARGYVLKGADKAEVLRTIRSVVAGEVLFGSEIANRMTDIFQNMGRTSLSGNVTASPFPDLTDRELEVLDLIARGENNHAIANQLHIATKTVSNHISNIFNKLEVADRSQAIIKAREAGLGQSSSTK